MTIQQKDDGNYLCPVCGYCLGENPWKDNCPTYEICDSCGIEFGYEDFSCDFQERKTRYDELRVKWISEGMPWRGLMHLKPITWNPIQQVKKLQRVNE